MNSMVPQRWVFRVCIKFFASDESLGYQHMGAVYYRERIPSASTCESHEGILSYRGMIKAIEELDCSSVHILLREPDKSEDKAEEANVATKEANVATKEAKENKIGASPTIRWRRPCIRVAVCLSIDQGKLLREHRGVEAGSRKGRGSDDEFRGAQLPKNKVSIRLEVDSEECYNAQRRVYRLPRKGHKC
ncbi:hypothetical protein B296_00013620 [Ensete ventricosum]|uniref:Uncharacterized protein n=1 Tax=Ensete ventricosum TaxID=4639 RepID=A0A427B6P4_ENSVE|nr:hypothetical protein B296_00013620 [Ensete ventricosum]